MNAGGAGERAGSKHMAEAAEGALTPFHWHEALDRALLAFEFFDERVAQHPAILATEELTREAEEIRERMFRLYQTIGTRALGTRG